MSELRVRGGPFLHGKRSMRGLMYEVLAALALVVTAATLFFGPVALLSCAAGAAGALLCERATRTWGTLGSLRDGSALITGLLLALTLPPSLPLWMVFLGGVVSIGVGKAVFGGLGQNPFNPALVGRAFLQAAFPTAITTWTQPQAPLSALGPALWSVPLTRGVPLDAVAGATPLGLAKFEHESTALSLLLRGNVAGSLGETSAALLLAIGVWLAARRVFDYRLAVGTLVSVLVCSSLLHLGWPELCPPPLFMLLSGGLLFGAVFMVTDPVTTPVTMRGAWLFGFGVGFLVVLIRVFGGLPEGVMYAILLMNSVSPLLDRYTQPKPFGAKVRV
ncbi:MAG: RnfABCDGE type electron transport complex subunit D [Myxococcales bacterium]